MPCSMSSKAEGKHEPSGHLHWFSGAICSPRFYAREMTMLSDKPLAGQVAWVTGSSRGLGHSARRREAESRTPQTPPDGREGRCDGTMNSAS